MKILTYLIPSSMTPIGKAITVGLYWKTHSIINGMELKSTKSEMSSIGIILTQDNKLILVL